MHGFYGVAFVFLDSSCFPDTTICLVLLFFRFLMGLETTELESGSEARVGVMLCVVHTVEYVGQMECLLSILVVNECWNVAYVCR